MQELGSAAMAIAMIAALLLLIGGVTLVRARESRVRGILMIGAAAVLVMNVVIWTI